MSPVCCCCLVDEREACWPNWAGSVSEEVFIDSSMFEISSSWFAVLILTSFQKREVTREGM